MERINQLNILRESNATLRSDCENYAKRSRELEAKLKELSTELEPAKEQARIAQGELQARDVQVKRLEAESRRWQDRNTQLLSKVCYFSVSVVHKSLIAAFSVRSHRPSRSSSSKRANRAIDDAKGRNRSFISG